jgi:hypothetical protein
MYTIYACISKHVYLTNHTHTQIHTHTSRHLADTIDENETCGPTALGLANKDKDGIRNCFLRQQRAKRVKLLLGSIAKN